MIVAIWSKYRSVHSSRSASYDKCTPRDLSDRCRPALAEPSGFAGRWLTAQKTAGYRKNRCVSKNLLSYQNAPFLSFSLGGERREGKGKAKPNDASGSVTLSMTILNRCLNIMNNMSLLFTITLAKFTPKLLLLELEPHVLTFPIHGCQWPGGLLVVNGLKRYFESVGLTKREPVSRGLEQLITQQVFAGTAYFLLNHLISLTCQFFFADAAYFCWVITMYLCWLIKFCWHIIFCWIS